MENCLCILHNLSYRLDAEVPNKYTQLNHMARNASMDRSLTGCFNSRGGKLEVRHVVQCLETRASLGSGKEQLHSHVTSVRKGVQNSWGGDYRGITCPMLSVMGRGESVSLFQTS